MPQFLNISPTTTMAQLTRQIGAAAVAPILAANSLVRAPNIGQQLADNQRNAVQNSGTIDWQRQSTVLNTLTDSSDVFERAALGSQNDWKILSNTNSLPGHLRVPDTMSLPINSNVLGNGEPVIRRVYDKVMASLANPPHIVDGNIFNEFSTRRPNQIINMNEVPDLLSWVPLPWGQVTLHSSMEDEAIDIPCYPEVIDDMRQANYDQMPELLFQHEPWQIYKSSGPRTISPMFKLHRDMWTGNHNDGLANNLIRFCEAQCYPEYRGASVRTSQCTLYIAGRPYFTGILTNVGTNWTGPIGHDGFYLVCEMELTFTEVSRVDLNYHSVRRKGVIS